MVQMEPEEDIELEELNMIVDRVEIETVVIQGGELLQS